MKIDADIYLLRAFGEDCTLAYSADYVDNTTKKFMRSALERLIHKLSKRITRISQPLPVKRKVLVTRSGTMKLKPAKRKTLSLSLNESELYVMQVSCQNYTHAYPDHENSIFIKTGFFEPLKAIN